MLDHYEMRDKRLLALWREEKKLWDRLMVVTPLAEPRQRGWIRTYVVSSRGGAQQHRAVLESILAVIGTERWSRTRDFLLRCRNRKSPILTEIDQPLKTISESEWKHKGYPDSWRRYFCLESMRHGLLWYPTLVYAHRRFLEFKVEPLILTEVAIPDPAIERRIAEIDQVLFGQNQISRLDRLRDRSQGRWKNDPRRKVIDRIHRREIRAAFMNFPEVDPASVIDWIRLRLRATFFPA